MSYILDALNRADALRADAAARSAHAVTPAALTAQRPLWARRLGGLLLASLLLGVGGWLGYRWSSRTAPARLPVPPSQTWHQAAAEPVASTKPITQSLASDTALSAPLAAPLLPARQQATLAPKPPARAEPLLLSELPASLRQSMPSLNVTGSVYSATPSQRLLLVNNQVLAQGSAVAADLKIEQIEPHSAVFSFRGTRFRLAY